MGGSVNSSKFLSEKAGILHMPEIQYVAYKVANPAGELLQARLEYENEVWQQICDLKYL